MPVVKVFRTLWRLLEPKKRATFLLLIALLFIAGTLEMGGMMILFGFVQGLHVDEETGVRQGPLGKSLEMVGFDELDQLQFVVWGGLIVVGFMIVKNVQGTTARFALNRFLMKLNQRLSGKLYEGYMLSPYEVLQRTGTRGAAGNINKIFWGAASCFHSTTQIVSDAFIVVMVLGLLLFVDLTMTLGSVVLFGLVGAALHLLLQKKLAGIGKETEKAKRQVGRFLNEGLQGLIDIRLRGTRTYFLRGYSTALGRNAVLNRRTFALARLPRSANEIALSAMIVGATLIITLQDQTIAEALPKLSVFGFAGLRLVGVMGRINDSVQSLRRNIANFESGVKTIEQMAPQAFPNTHEKPKDYLSEERSLPAGTDGRLHNALQLSSVSFSYPASKTIVVDDISLTVKKGENVAICGSSGSGKSTLLLLFMGLMKPQQGTVTCDGWSVHEYIQPWHRNLGYVSQSLFLVGRTVRENVAFGIEPSQIDDEKVWAALKLASADEFVAEMPKKIHTSIGESGSRLSGGQQQRIGIARALYEDPDILILDEATAALDNVTERAITDALRALSGKKTVISVAHRLSSVRECDRIYFLDKGKLSGEGTYDQLLENNEKFRHMVKASPKPSS